MEFGPPNLYHRSTPLIHKGQDFSPKYKLFTTFQYSVNTRKLCYRKDDRAMCAI